MPGSLLAISSKVHRSDSTRSDSDASSDSRASAKKVSFNKAVRVKKYPRRNETYLNGGKSNGNHVPNEISPEKRFWFKVYKNRHHHEPNMEQVKREYDYSTSNSNDKRNGFDKDNLTSVIRTNDITDETGEKISTVKSFSLGRDSKAKRDDSFSNQVSPEAPRVKNDHVRNIVKIFNKEAFYRHENTNNHPEAIKDSKTKNNIVSVESFKTPADRLEVNTKNIRENKPKKNKIFNGVKVIFGMTHLKKKDNKNLVNSKNQENTVRNYREHCVPSEVVSTNPKGPFMTDDRIMNDLQERPFGRLRKNSSSSWRSFDENDSSIDIQPIENKINIMRAARSAEILRGPSLSSLNSDTWKNSDRTVPNNNTFMTNSLSQHEKRFQTFDESDHILKEHRWEESCDDKHTSNNRRVKSCDDLLTDYDNSLCYTTAKGVSSDNIYQKQDDRDWPLDKLVEQQFSQHAYKLTEEKGVQCSKASILRDSSITCEIEDQARIIRSKDGFVSAYSNVPMLDYHNSNNHNKCDMETGFMNCANSEAIYSRVNKQKEKKAKEKNNTLGEKFRSESSLFDMPSNKLHHYATLPYEGSLNELKTKNDSSGLKLNTGLDNHNKHKTLLEETRVWEKNDKKKWYNVDRKLSEKNYRGSYFDISYSKEADLSSEATNRYHKNRAISSSVIRELNPQKQEISYENVPYQNDRQINSVSVGGGLCPKMAEEDYRREMAQSDVSYQSSCVENDTNSSMNRVEKKDDVNRRVFTLNKQQLKEKEKQNEKVHLLMKKQDLEESFSEFRNDQFYVNDTKGRGTHSDHYVQSDSSDVRRGFSSASQSQQKVPVRRSNSTAISGNSRERKNRHYGYLTGSSAASGVSSSDSDSTRRRKPLVMYIPGISHYEKHADQNEQCSSVARVVRSRSVLSSKPGKYQKRGVNKYRHHVGDTSEVISEEPDTLAPLATSGKFRKSKHGSESKSRSDLQRRHSMPKDAKFSWFKWKVRVRPSRES